MYLAYIFFRNFLSWAQASNVRQNYQNYCTMLYEKSNIIYLNNENSYTKYEDIL